MSRNTKRLYMCLFVFLLIQFPLPSRSDLDSSASDEPERNQFDLPLSGLVEHASHVKRGESLSSIMNEWGIPSDQIHQASAKASSFIDPQKIDPGDPLYAYTDPLSGTTSFIVYQPSKKNFVVFDVRDSVLVHEDEFPVSTVTRTRDGTIQTSLYSAIRNAGLPLQLATELSDIFAWQISFFHLQPGDEFSILYEDHLVNDQSVATQVKAARMKHKGEDFFAFYFSADSSSTFYDETGHALRRPFLRAPINYRRISSKFSLRRFHPVQKHYRPHLGTDFAAAPGTPIVATADGDVIRAAYTSANGNYVKIKHNDVYSTGYLHMSRFAQGIREGVRVQQGQLIGYVGSTGMATGPHVCYRFWKNGQQIDALTVKMPPSEPLSATLMPQFTKLVRRLQPQLMLNSSSNDEAL